LMGKCDDVVFFLRKTFFWVKRVDGVISRSGCLFVDTLWLVMWHQLTGVCLLAFV
jgi:hypothetical protein